MLHVCMYVFNNVSTKTNNVIAFLLSQDGVSEHASCQCHCLSLCMAPKKLQNWTLAGQVERARFDGYLYSIEEMS
jgi:hypothetical protein